MPSDDPKLLIKDEIARAQGVERDLISEIMQSRRLAWRVTIFLSLIALILVVKDAMTPPPPLPEIYVVRVNDATGAIEHFTRLGDAKESYNERIDRFFIQEYLLACESYDWSTIQNMYDRCGLYSDPSVQKQYYEKFKGSDGLDKRYADHSRVRIDVNTITLGPNQSAIVRFTRQVESSMGQKIGDKEYLLATLAYAYINADMTEETGRKNPLGFQVITYDTDIEVGTRP